MEVRVNVTIAPDTDIRAWVQSTADLEPRGGIPVLYLGGDDLRDDTNQAPVGITFYGYDHEDLLASLDRFAAGVELLRQAVIDHRDEDRQVVAAGQVIPLPDIPLADPDAIMLAYQRGELS